MRKLHKISLGIMAGLLMVGTITNIPSYATVSGTNTLVNYNSTNTGVAPTGTNENAHISEDGNLIAWYSNSHNVIPGDPYSSSTASSIYVKNLLTGVTSYANTDTSGTPVHVASARFAMSRTGRYIAYTTINSVVSSPSLSGIGRGHVYLRDMQTGSTTLVDKTSSGTLSNAPDNMMAYASSVSDDGRFVLFDSYANNLLTTNNPANTSIDNYYVKDIMTGQVINPAISNAGVRANSLVGRAYMSCDGAMVAFSTDSTNLTPQDNGNFNAYLVDLRNGQNITNLTHGSNQGVSLVSFSCNARYLVLSSLSTNLTVDSVSGTISHYFRYDRLIDTYALVDKSSLGYISTTKSPASNFDKAMRIVSDDGKVIFRNDDTNMISPAASWTREVYLRNPEAGTTELVPVNSSGTEQNQIGIRDTLEINARGDAVIYSANSTNLVPGITTGATMLVLSKVQ
jgi:hypothetical protein